MTMFQFENLNEKLFNRVVCFAYSYPSGLGGPGTLLMYTEDGEEYLADQRGLVEYDWFKLDEIVPFRDESRFKEYYWGIGVHLYIRNDLYDKVMEWVLTSYSLSDEKRRGGNICTCHENERQ